jgi:hypothetical protein
MTLLSMLLLLLLSAAVQLLALPNARAQVLRTADIRNESRQTSQQRAHGELYAQLQVHAEQVPPQVAKVSHLLSQIHIKYITLRNSAKCSKFGMRCSLLVQSLDTECCSHPGFILTNAMKSHNLDNALHGQRRTGVAILCDFIDVIIDVIITPRSNKDSNMLPKINRNITAWRPVAYSLAENL